MKLASDPWLGLAMPRSINDWSSSTLFTLVSRVHRIAVPTPIKHTTVRQLCRPNDSWNESLNIQTNRLGELCIAQYRSTCTDRHWCYRTIRIVDVIQETGTHARSLSPRCVTFPLQPNWPSEATKRLVGIYANYCFKPPLVLHVSLHGWTSFLNDLHVVPPLSTWSLLKVLQTGG